VFRVRHNPRSSDNGTHLRQHVHALAERLWHSWLLHVLRQHPTFARIRFPQSHRVRYFDGGNDRRSCLLPGAHRRRFHCHQGERQQQRQRCYRAVWADHILNGFLNTAFVSFGLLATLILTVVCQVLTTRFFVSLLLFITCYLVMIDLLLNGNVYSILIIRNLYVMPRY